MLKERKRQKDNWLRIKRVRDSTHTPAKSGDTSVVANKAAQQIQHLPRKSPLDDGGEDEGPGRIRGTNARPVMPQRVWSGGRHRRHRRRGRGPTRDEGMAAWSASQPGSITDSVTNGAFKGENPLPLYCRRTRRLWWARRATTMTPTTTPCSGPPNAQPKEEDGCDKPYHKEARQTTDDTNTA